MNSQNQNVKLNQRVSGQGYPLKINQSALDILSLIFEFKLAAAWHVSRFIIQEEQNIYIELNIMIAVMLNVRKMMIGILLKDTGTKLYRKKPSCILEDKVRMM